MKTEANNSEKVSINFSAMELGQIDALVEQGFYTDRSDLIRNTVRTELDKRSKELEKILKGPLPADTSLANEDGIIAMTGVLKLGRKELESYKAKGIKLVIKLIGALVIEKDVPVELVRETIESVKVWGNIRASEEIKELL